MDIAKLNDLINKAEENMVQVGLAHNDICLHMVQVRLRRKVERDGFGAKIFCFFSIASHAVEKPYFLSLSPLVCISFFHPLRYRLVSTKSSICHTVII